MSGKSASSPSQAPAIGAPASKTTPKCPGDNLNIPLALCTSSGLYLVVENPEASGFPASMYPDSPSGGYTCEEVLKIIVAYV